MKFISKLFSENKEISCMRVMAMLSLFAAIGIAFYSLHLNCALDGATPTISIFVGASFGGKVWQKYVESKPENEK